MSDMAVSHDDLVSLVMRMVAHLNTENKEEENIEAIRSTALTIRSEKAMKYMRTLLGGLSIHDLTSIVEIIDKAERPAKKQKRGV